VVGAGSRAATDAIARLGERLRAAVDKGGGAAGGKGGGKARGRGLVGARG